MINPRSQNVKQSPRPPKVERNRRVGLVTLRCHDNPEPELDFAGGERRRRMIELAAYYKAERRGFAPGGELEDWLDAEDEISAGEKRTRSD